MGIFSIFSLEEFWLVLESASDESLSLSLLKKDQKIRNHEIPKKSPKMSKLFEKSNTQHIHEFFITAKTSKTTTFSRVFHPIFSGNQS